MLFLARGLFPSRESELFERPAQISSNPNPRGGLPGTSFSYILLVDPITRERTRRPARRPFSAGGAPPGSPAAGPGHPARRRAGGGGRAAHRAPGKDRPPHVREPAVRAVGPPQRTAGRRKALAGQGRRGARRAGAAGGRAGGPTAARPPRSDRSRSASNQVRVAVEIGHSSTLRDTTDLAGGPSELPSQRAAVLQKTRLGQDGLNYPPSSCGGAEGRGARRPYLLGCCGG